MNTSSAVALCARRIAIVIATIVLTSCAESAPSAATSTPPALVALVRTGADAPAHSVELAAGIAVEIGNRLSGSADVVMPSVIAPMVDPDVTFGEASDRLAVAMVIWVDVTGTPEEPVLRYTIETPEGESSAASLPLNGDAALSAPGRIAEEALTLVGGEPSGEFLQMEPPVPASDYARFLRALGKSYAGATADERVAWYEALAPSLTSYQPAVVELGHAYLDLAGTVPGTGPYYQRAEETLRRAFQMDPQYPPARYVLASCLTKLGRSEEAVALLLDGLAGHATYAPYHDQLGYVARYAGLMDESMASYRRAQELDRGLENLVATQDQITKSLIYLGRHAEALASHDRMESFLGRLGRSPDEKEWFYRGVIHLYAGELDHALESFRRGEETDASTIWTQFGRGYAAVARGDTARVAQVLDALERSVVVDGERRYRLVHLAAFLGDVERAIGHLETATQAGFFAAPYFTSDLLTVNLREHAAFSAALSTAQERHRAFGAKMEEGVGRTSQRP